MSQKTEYQCLKAVFVAFYLDFDCLITVKMTLVSCQYCDWCCTPKGKALPWLCPDIWVKFRDVYSLLVTRGHKR